MLTALVAQEHVLLVGPPGCGKSLLLDSVMNWMHGKRFSHPVHEVHLPRRSGRPGQHRRAEGGPLPPRDDRQAARGRPCLPRRGASRPVSAILNTLLRILNERVFENGDGSFVHVPLKLCVAASNEWPQSQEGGKELAALFDRFLFRRSVRPILSGAGRKRLLWDRDHTPKLSTSITPAEVDQAHADAMALPWSKDGQEALETILRELAKEGIQPGDRRQFKAVACAQAFAWLNGAERVEPEHLEILAHVLWDDPQEQPEKVARVIARIANPVGHARQPAPAGVRADRVLRGHQEPGPGGHGHGEARRDRPAAGRAQGQRPRRACPRLRQGGDPQDQGRQHRGDLTPRSRRTCEPRRVTRDA